MHPDPAELLSEAARCYDRAGWHDDAERLFAQLESSHDLASLYERQDNLERAAEQFARAGDWLRAADCHRRRGDWLQQAQSLLQAGRTLEAAWTWADRTPRAGAALAAVNKLAVSTNADRLAVELINARCDVTQGKPQRAARRLRSVLRKLPRMADLDDVAWQRTLSWGQQVAHAMRRPDLQSLVYAAAVSAHRVGAREQWSRWAHETFGPQAGCAFFTAPH